MLQADEPLPDENLLPPPDEESQEEARLGSDLEEGGGEVDSPVGSEGDDGEDLLENVSGWAWAICLPFVPSLHPSSAPVLQGLPRDARAGQIRPTPHRRCGL